MDENAISVLCNIPGCEWRIVGDTRCPQHGGYPCYAWEPSIWGDDAEYMIAGDNSPETFTQPVLEGHHA